jgi:antitoxin (DNA-binding transcriptional repressor) of toxin-antitoxin stability system
MTKVGIREIEAQAEEIVRRLRDEHETFELTYQGETVGKIVPLRTPVDRAAIEKSWREWEVIFDEIAANVVDEVSLEETMREVRRPL